LVLAGMLFVFRASIPGVFKGLAGRISKVEIAGVSVELARAKAFVPVWSGSSTALDLRHKASAIQVTDSTAGTFLTQLAAEGTGDYAVINLGIGKEWLTSRLYIMAILFARMKGIGCFVFLETSGAVRKRFVGWAEPSRIRWELARKYPWFEQAYAQAYAVLNSQRNTIVVGPHGRIGYQHAPDDANAGIELLREFLTQIQMRAPFPQFEAWEDEWVVVDTATGTREHASWINAEDLEEVGEQLRAFLYAPGQFVAVVGGDQRFEYLVRRDVLVEQAAKMAVVDPDRS